MSGLRRGLVLALPAALWAAAPRPPEVLTVASPRGERRIAVRTERGYPALAVPDLALVLSLEEGNASPGNAEIRLLGRPFAFVLDASYFQFEGRLYVLVAAPYVARDSLFVPLQWAVEFLPRLVPGRFRYDERRARLEELSSTPVAAAPRRRRVVAIDPGHGGRDPGMRGPLGRQRFLREKDVTLAVARALADELERRGVGVALTRTTDTLIALGDRGRLAASRGADLFVSIHVNAANPGWRNAERARGFETYFLAEATTEDARRVEQMENAAVRFETTAEARRGDPLRFILRDLAQNEHLRESSRLAELVQDAVGRTHPAESRGVKQALFHVLATSYMPAVLIEAGFGTNAAEARYLTSAAGQRAIARAIADGVERWLVEYERRLATGAP